jgi:hypothetical protein
VEAARKNVIAVDFAGRRRMRERLPDTPAVATAREIIGQSRDFLLFWRPPGRRAAAEYLGSKWDWGWTLFVWTSEATVGPMRADLATRGYLAQWLTREGFLSFLHRATEIGGVLFDGELEDGGARIRAEPQQLVRRLDAVTVLDA